MAAALNQVIPRQSPSMGRSAIAAAADASPEFSICFDDALGLSSKSGGDAVPELGAETSSDATQRAKRAPPKHPTIDAALVPNESAVQAATALLVSQMPRVQTPDTAAISASGAQVPEAAPRVQLGKAAPVTEQNSEIVSNSEDPIGTRAQAPAQSPLSGMAISNLPLRKNEASPQDFRLDSKGRPSETSPSVSSVVPPAASLSSTVTVKPAVEFPAQAIGLEYVPSGSQAQQPGTTIRELMHRLSNKAESVDAGIGEPDPSTIKSNVFPPAGIIPGVVGMLRLEHEPADAEGAEIDMPSNPAYGGPSLHSSESRTTAPLAAVSIPPTVTSPQWAEAFGSAVVQFATTDVGEAKLTLSPDEMGTISVTIGIDGSLVSVGFAADNQVVRDAVTASLPLLQDMLAKSGLSLSQSTVGREQSNEAPAKQPFLKTSGIKPAAASNDLAVAPPRHRPAADALVDTFA